MRRAWAAPAASLPRGIAPGELTINRLRSMRYQLRNRRGSVGSCRADISGCPRLPALEPGAYASGVTDIDAFGIELVQKANNLSKR